ncbi:hypothetical protein B5X24_HaOG213433 [Helicoverpa armigera]|nr:hypothetical protein B5X24_HaOG213433 [Helicoverpa armigera]
MAIVQELASTGYPSVGAPPCKRTDVHERGLETPRLFSIEISLGKCCVCIWMQWTEIDVTTLMNTRDIDWCTVFITMGQPCD